MDDEVSSFAPDASNVETLDLDESLSLPDQSVDCEVDNRKLDVSGSFPSKENLDNFDNLGKHSSLTQIELDDFPGLSDQCPNHK